MSRRICRSSGSSGAVTAGAPFPASSSNLAHPYRCPPRQIACSPRRGSAHAASRSARKASVEHSRSRRPRNIHGCIPASPSGSTNTRMVGHSGTACARDGDGQPGMGQIANHQIRLCLRNKFDAAIQVAASPTHDHVALAPQQGTYSLRATQGVIDENQPDRLSLRA